MMNINLFVTCDILGSHSGEYKDDSLLGYSAVCITHNRSEMVAVLGMPCAIPLCNSLALFSLIEVDRHFRGVYCLHHEGTLTMRLHGTISQKAVFFIFVIC
jgi:hypothetical protein